jgi:hypothetical protein
LYFSYTLLGTTLFWKYDKFKNITTTSDSLLSIFFGDIILDSFSDLKDEGIIG